MNEPQVVIKIIPPNPFTNSIIIAYCYIENKSVPCQVIWTRLQQNQISLLNKSPQLHSSQGSTYKCSPLDFNNYIEVSIACEWNGRIIQRKSRTQLVKMNRQLVQQKNRIHTVNCKIYTNNILVQCQMNLETNGILQLIAGYRRFNLQLTRQSCYIQSQFSFKTTIGSHRYQFLTFLIQSNQVKTNSTQSDILQNSNIFEFDFQSQIQRDLILLHICQSKRQYHEKSNNSNANHENISAEKTKRSFKEIQYKHKKGEQFKQYQKHQIKYGTPQNSQSKYNIQNYEKDSSVVSSKKKIQKIKVSQRIFTSGYDKISNGILAFGSENLAQEKNNEQQIQLERDNAKTQKYISRTPNYQNKDFLNIFQEDNSTQHIKTEPQLSSALVSISKTKNKPNHSLNAQEDIPSINLRGSFQQLQKSFTGLAGEVQINNNSKKVSKQISKQKRQIIRDYSYQYPKTKGQTKIDRSFESYKNSTLIELNELKKQNAILKKQAEMLPILTKENNSLKKKYYQLNEEVNRLELEKKQILADKLRYQASLNKEKLQKDHLKQQLNILKNLMKNKQNYQSNNESYTKNQQNSNGIYLNNTNAISNNISNFATRDGTKFTSSAGFNNQSNSNGFMHSFRTNQSPSTYSRTYVNQYGKQFSLNRQ